MYFCSLPPMQRYDPVSFPCYSTAVQVISEF
jgi:hypothetical protein